MAVRTRSPVLVSIADLASCPRCRDVVMVRRFSKTPGRCCLMNPGPYHREAILALPEIRRTMQGVQMPGGSYHRSNCVPFKWTIPGGNPCLATD